MELEIPVDEGAVEISLDEWKILQKQSRPKQELQLRKLDSGVPVKAIVIHTSRHLEVSCTISGAPSDWRCGISVLLYVPRSGPEQGSLWGR